MRVNSTRNHERNRHRALAGARAPLAARGGRFAGCGVFVFSMQPFDGSIADTHIQQHARAECSLPSLGPAPLPLLLGQRCVPPNACCAVLCVLCFRPINSLAQV